MSMRARNIRNRKQKLQRSNKRHKTNKRVKQVEFKKEITKKEAQI